MEVWLQTLELKESAYAYLVASNQPPLNKSGRRTDGLFIKCEGAIYRIGNSIDARLPENKRESVDDRLDHPILSYAGNLLLHGTVITHVVASSAPRVPHLIHLHVHPPSFVKYLDSTSYLSMQPQSPSVKIIFWGTSEFAIPSLETLIEHGYRIAAVVTNPDALSGRKRILTPPPVKKQTVKSARPIEILQPEDLTVIRRTLLAINPDLYIVAAYGKILPKAILDIPKYGALNIHPSLLPRWRGPAPIQYTILNGDAETGVTIIKMDEEMDHGPILAQRELGISKLQITNYKPMYTELHNNLANLGAELLIDVLPKWIRGEIAPVPQDESKATYSKILTKANGRINWTKPAEEIERMIRAFNPWPGAWTLLPVEYALKRIKIEESQVVPEEPPDGIPGLIWQNERGLLLVKTGRASLRIRRLTMEGKQALTEREFLHGSQHIIGKNLV